MNPHDSVPGNDTCIKAPKDYTNNYLAAEILLVLQKLPYTTFILKEGFKLERKVKAVREQRVTAP